MLQEIENATTEPMQLNEFTVSHPRARNEVITICFPGRTNEKAFRLFEGIFPFQKQGGGGGNVKKKIIERSGSLRSNWIHTVRISHLLRALLCPKAATADATV